MPTLGSAVGWTAVAVVFLALLTSGSSWAADPGDADAGRQVFESACAMCHGHDAAGMMGMHPSLRGAVDRLSRQGVEVTVRNGRATNPPMPAFGGRLTDDQIDDVVAYIGSLPSGPRNFGPEAGDGGMMGGGMMGGDVWAFVAGALTGLLVALVGVGAVWLVRARSGGPPQRSGPPEGSP